MQVGQAGWYDGITEDFINWDKIDLMKHRSCTEKTYGEPFLVITPIWFQNLEYLSLTTALIYVAVITKSSFVFFFAGISFILHGMYIVSFLWDKFPKLSFKNFLIVNIISIPIMLAILLLIIYITFSQISPIAIPSVLEIIRNL